MNGVKESKWHHACFATSVVDGESRCLGWRLLGLFIWDAAG